MQFFSSGVTYEDDDDDVDDHGDDDDDDDYCLLFLSNFIQPSIAITNTKATQETK